MLKQGCSTSFWPDATNHIGHTLCGQLPPPSAMWATQTAPSPHEQYTLPCSPPHGSKRQLQGPKKHNGPLKGHQQLEPCAKECCITVPTLQFLQPLRCWDTRNERQNKSPVLRKWVDNPRWEQLSMYNMLNIKKWFTGLWRRKLC